MIWVLGEVSNRGDTRGHVPGFRIRALASNGDVIAEAPRQIFQGSPLPGEWSGFLAVSASASRGIAADTARL